MEDWIAADADGTSEMCRNGQRILYGPIGESNQCDVPAAGRIKEQ